MLEIVFNKPTDARYLKIHCTFDDRDADLAPVDASQFSNTAENIIRVYTQLQLVAQDNFEYDAVGGRAVEAVWDAGVSSTFYSSYYAGTYRVKTARFERGQRPLRFCI